MLLRKLTETLGVSGDEGAVRKIILEQLTDYVDDIQIDRMGNVIAVKKGNNKGPHVILGAHMDEVGLMVKGIEDSGLIRFTPVGGMDPRILVSKVVLIGEDRVTGVIGAKAVHMQKPAERKKALSVDNLYIDIGCTSKKEAEKHVSPGDYIAFDSKYVEFGDKRVKAKALDDRVGCATIIELLKKELPVSVTGVFTVQEELGLRGAAVAANHVEGDLAILLEGTTCSDVTDVEPHQQATEVDKGPAISLMDRTSIYSRNLVDSLVQTAEENNIPWQFRRTTFGGNDAGRFHVAKEGTPCLSIAVPCRYIHSPVSVMSKNDYENMGKLLMNYLEKINEGGIL